MTKLQTVLFEGAAINLLGTVTQFYKVLGVDQKYSFLNFNYFTLMLICGILKL